MTHQTGPKRPRAETTQAETTGPKRLRAETTRYRSEHTVLAQGCLSNTKGAFGIVQLFCACHSLRTLEILYICVPHEKLTFLVRHICAFRVMPL